MVLSWRGFGKAMIRGQDSLDQSRNPICCYEQVAKRCTIDSFIQGLPKAELHCHIEGTLEPEMLFDISARNGTPTAYRTVEELRAAYDFTDLQSFLDIYYEGAAVLQTEEDFYDLTWAYLERAARDGVRRAEIFFDPQTHTERGIDIGTVINGISAALDRGADLGISGGLILCFVRHLPADQAVATLETALTYRSKLLGVGLDSSEVGHPPDQFKPAFDLARQEGLHLVAHAGEEGPPDYIWQALEVLGAERIDHGVRAIEDSALITRLAADAVPLTMCPLSNLKLKVVDDLSDHPLRRLLHSGVRVTINSDDPAYFGGYVGDNYDAIERGLGLEREELIDLVGNSLKASFLPDDDPLFAEFDQQVGASRLID